MADRPGVTWFPEGLHEVAETATDLSEFSYVVVEERVDEVLLLVAWSWPRADDEGRLSWPDEDPERNGNRPRRAAVTVELLRAQLYAPSGLKRRPRLGDVFATRSLGEGWDTGEPIDDVRSLLVPPVYDVTADAREAAKVAYRGSLAAIPPPDEATLDERRLLREADRARRRHRAKELTIGEPPEVTAEGDD